MIQSGHRQWRLLYPDSQSIGKSPESMNGMARRPRLVEQARVVRIRSTASRLGILVLQHPSPKYRGQE